MAIHANDVQYVVYESTARWQNRISQQPDVSLNVRFSKWLFRPRESVGWDRQSQFYFVHLSPVSLSESQLVSGSIPFNIFPPLTNEFLAFFIDSFPSVPVVPGDVKQIEGGRVYQVRNDVSPDSELTIFCWKGRPKTPLSIWESAKVQCFQERLFKISFKPYELSGEPHFSKKLPQYRL